MGLTRRRLLQDLGQIGGFSAAFLGMEALGLLRATPAGAADFALPAGSGEGRSVVILGAGIAGLVSAYELSRAGYQVKVLEASNRIGGRVWTVRGGDRIEQIGHPDQTVGFTGDGYLNAGATRIPSTHHLILSYARRFGVALAPFVNTNRSAGWDFEGKVVTEGQAVNDMRGQISELLAKAIDQGALDGEMEPGELEMFRQFLNPYGGLGPDGVYSGGGRGGYTRPPGAYGDAGVPRERLAIGELLPSFGVILPHLFETIWDQQAPMLEAVGGTDAIPRAIYREVRETVRLSTPVTAIRRIGERVCIEHGDAATEADYCICTLPAKTLARIPSDLSTQKRSALAAIEYDPSVKVAFETPRFWESDDHIYGGVAWTDRLNESLMYPSSGFHEPRGVLVAGYSAGWTRRDTPDAFSALSHEERFRICRESVDALHPGKARLLEAPVTVSWGETRWADGASPRRPWPIGDAAYAELFRPEGPIVFAGEHLSYVPAWMEGAALSAHEAMKLVAEMAGERREEAA